jgi:hypothetical protein
MVKIFEVEHTFNHTWANVTSAFWRKYPNDFQSHVQEVDTYNRSIDANGNLIVDRVVCHAQKSIPSFLTSIGVPNIMYGLERTIVNPQKKEMIVKSINIGGSSIQSVEETCIYRQDKEDPTRTQFIQKATLTASVPLIYHKIEGYSLSRFHVNAPKGLHAMESLCKKVSDEGINILLDPFYSVRSALDTAIGDTQAEFANIMNNISPSPTPQ